MEVNWVEALWINSPFRIVMQARELRFSLIGGPWGRAREYWRSGAVEARARPW